MSGACPGIMPRYPFFPGIWTSSAAVSTTFFSGVTISSWKVSAIQNPASGFRLSASPNSSWRKPGRRKPGAHNLRCRLHLLCGFEHFLDRALHIESLLGDVIVLAFNNRFEALHSVGDLDVAPLCAGELLGHVERLRQESLNLASTGDSEFLIFA